MADDTIYALSSGAPPSAIAVIRISGPRAADALVALGGTLPAPRRASLRWTCHPESGERLDRGLVLWFPGPKTATGEDLAELHLHGGRAVIAAVLAALAIVPGLIAAEAGAFTRRAFANGVLDLAAAEGLADLLAAETEMQRRAALGAAGGALGRRILGWQDRLLSAVAMVEAQLDFADEGDVLADLGASGVLFGEVGGEIGALLARPSVERLRDGVRIVVAGPPNAGKSTLVNALVARDVAIVSDEAGTTRDLIEVPVAIAGMPLLVIDTAGVREGESAIERIGIARAQKAIADADILLWLGERTDLPHHPEILIVQSKIDAVAVNPGADMHVSPVTGEGMENLIGRLVSMAGHMLPGVNDVIANERQRRLLADAHAALIRAADGNDALLQAEDARHALRQFDAVTGRAGVEDMLDALFGRFCIGK